MDCLGNLDDGPERPWPYLWADFIEIACLSTLDKVATAQTLRRGFLGIDVSGADTELFDSPEMDLANGADARPRRADEFERLINDGFQHAEDRERQYGNLYPFAVDKGARRLALKEPLSEGNKLYVALLLCSNHRYVPGQQHALTRGFEVMCWHALKSLLPDGSDIRLAGTTHAGSAIGIPAASSKKPDKLRAMAALLRTKAEIGEDVFWAQDTGDEGADLLGIVPFGEEETPEEIVVLGQCATSNDNWAGKQHDAAASKWMPLLGLLAPNLNFLFLASSPRRYGNSFERGVIRGGHSTWLDRQRILRRLAGRADGHGEQAQTFMTDKVWQLVANVLDIAAAMEHHAGHAPQPALM